MIPLSPTLVVASLSAVTILGFGALISRRLTGRARGIAPVDQDATDRMTRRSWLRPLSGNRAVASAVVITIGLFTIGLFVFVLLLVFWLTARTSIPLLRRRRHQRDTEHALPGTVELLVLSIQAGLTPDQAIRELSSSAHAATRPAFAEVVCRMDRGEPLVDALSALPEELGPRAAVLAEVIGSASRYGLPLSQVLEQLSAEFRSSRRRLNEAAARRLPVRLSFPLVVCTLPSFVLLAIAPAVIAALSSLGGYAP